MGLHPYCIVPAGSRSGGTGIQQQPVAAIAAAGLAAWCTAHDHPPEPTPDHLQEHDRVVRSAFTDDVTPVPLRFGQWFADQAELQRQLREHARQWRQALRRLAGTAELGVQVSLALPVPAPGALPAEPRRGPAPGLPERGKEPPGSGRAYLEQLRATFRVGEAALEAQRLLLEPLAAALGGLVLETCADPVPAPGDSARVAYLVRRADLHACEDALAQLRRRRPDLRVSVTGPWPPYTFVGS